MVAVKNYINDFLHLLFPHNCLGCSTDVLNNEDALCARCLSQLPQTDFFSKAGNPIEKIFYGRLPVESAGSAFYFNKNSLLQHLIIQLKYKGNRDAGIYLGKLLGNYLSASNRFEDVEAIIPVPLNDKKSFKRGYNQASLLITGITEIWKKPIIDDAIERKSYTETQTHKDRISRWQTMEDVFAIINSSKIKGKHILLVDDVITTGATLESCGHAILQAENVKLSIATLAYTI